MRTRTLVCAATVAWVAAGCVAMACGSDPVTLVSADSGVDVEQPDTFVRQEAGDSGTVIGACDAGQFDFQGCGCPNQGETRVCTLGIPGPKSGCKTAGTQLCTGANLWSACVGASRPDAEVCFDDVDNDCNGVVDDGCKCGENVNICIRPGFSADAGDAAYFPATTYNWLVDPSPPSAGRPYDLILVTKNALPPQVSLVFDTLCFGGGSSAPCPSPGTGCAGWNAVRFHLTSTAAGVHNVHIYVQDTNPPCTGTEVNASNFTYTVVP